MQKVQDSTSRCNYVVKADVRKAKHLSLFSDIICICLSLARAQGNLSFRWWFGCRLPPVGYQTTTEFTVTYTTKDYHQEQSSTGIQTSDPALKPNRTLQWGQVDALNY